MMRKKNKALTTLIDRLEMLVESYSSCRIVPRKFGYPFAMDYYKSDNCVLTPFSVNSSALSDTVKFFSGSPIIFFYSAGLKPVHISFLRRFISFQRRNISSLLEKYHSALLDSKIVEMTNVAETMTNTMKDEIEEKTDSMWDAIEEQFREQSSSNIKLLGFLGSFIAFVSAGVHSLNTDLGVENFTTLLKAVVSCILAFVVMLNFITLPKDEEIEKYSKSYTASLFFAMIIVIVLVFL